MAGWVWPAAAGVVTSATGVAINLATDVGASPWAWVAVVLLTAVGVVVAVRLQPATPQAPTSAVNTTTNNTTVNNSITGALSGDVVQTVQSGPAGPISLDSQAGRDVRRNP
jgi:23S rRNA U2552 (ribose-2'-O)-methylase RlmE/FtsJ